MLTEVIMPDMGDSVAEGTITKWLVEVGGRVERDEGLFEISTDKVDAEIPSPASGVLRQILCPAGTTVPVNAVVAWITTDMAEPVPAVETTLPSFSPQPSASSRSTMPGAETLIEILHLTRGEEKELRQIVGLDPPAPRSRFERLLHGSLTGKQATLTFIVLLALSYAIWELFNRLRPWGETLFAFSIPFLIFSFIVQNQRYQRIVFKLYRALEEERRRRTGGDQPV